MLVRITIRSLNPELNPAAATADELARLLRLVPRVGDAAVLAALGAALLAQLLGANARQRRHTGELGARAHRPRGLLTPLRSFPEQLPAELPVETQQSKPCGFWCGNS